jgi:DMSO/TMAO reductase YedYZ molybdopterin-dependent catalytic subunit
MAKPERGLFELYRDDPERADALVFGRRGLLKGASLAAMGAALGAAIPFAARMPSGLVPAALAQAPAAAPKMLSMPGKAGIVILQDRPLVCETPEHMLDDEVTPNDRFFIRNNGGIPDVAADPKAWKIKVDGEVNTPLELAVGELETRFQAVTLKLQLECGGNGRSGFQPEARGNQWGNGAIGCAEYAGVRLKDVLAAAGLKPSAVYTGHFGADPHLSGTPGQASISRGVRLAKAMDEHTLIVLRMNGQPLPHIHGGPARLLVPGWPGSASQKWLTRIWIRDKEHDGQGMTGTSYRVTKKPMIPGGKVDDANMAILESMPVRSIITNVTHGAELPSGTRKLPVRGHAWAGDLAVGQVDVSADYGATWKKAELKAPANKYAWQRWSAEIEFPSEGYYEIWAKATDSGGKAQPHVVGNWNPQGYGGNAFHRVAVLVKA